MHQTREGANSDADLPNAREKSVYVFRGLHQSIISVTTL